RLTRWWRCSARPSRRRWGRSHDRAARAAPPRKREARMVGVDSMTFRERVGLITGAGSGIGRATARLLAERGGAGVAADVNGVTAEETAALIRASGGQAAASACDVTRAADVDAAVGLARRTFGRLDVVVNCAGILRVAPLEDTSEKEWEEVLAVNLTGAFILTRAALRALREQGGGAIVHIASRAAIRAK